MSTSAPAPELATADLSRSQKAAAVLLALGTDKAAKVMAFLSEAEVEQVAVEIAQLGQLGAEQTNAILDEFRTEAIAAEYLVSGGAEHARMLLRTLHGSAGDDILDRLLASFRSNPFHFLQMHDPQEVLQHLREENPQTLALILSHLPTRFGAQILTGLEPALQADVAWRVAALDRTSPEVVSRVEQALQRRFGDVRRRDNTARGGVRELAALLNSSDRATERAILNELEMHNPEMAEAVRALMFVFEDIVAIDDRAMQEILRQVDLKRLAYAMKGVADAVSEKVLSNLSERARETLVEEIELLGPVPAARGGAGTDGGGLAHPSSRGGGHHHHRPGWRRGAGRMSRRLQTPTIDGPARRLDAPTPVLDQATRDLVARAEAEAYARGRADGARESAAAAEHAGRQAASGRHGGRRRGPGAAGGQRCRPGARGDRGRPQAGRDHPRPGAAVRRHGAARPGARRCGCPRPRTVHGARRPGRRPGARRGA